jgi:hypothetical protein
VKVPTPCEKGTTQRINRRRGKRDGDKYFGTLWRKDKQSKRDTRIIY